MQRWKNIFWVSAGILTLATLVASITPQAIAQIRAALVREMDSPVRGIAFAQAFQGLFSLGDFDQSAVISPVVPAGKKLFLQSISVRTALTNSQSVMHSNLSIQPSGVVRLWVAQDFQAASTAGSNQRHFIGNRDINILLNTGETLLVSIARNDNIGDSSTNFFGGTIYGYLVDVNP